MLVSIGNDIEESMNRYFRGQALVAGLVGILFSIGFLIVGLPLAIVLGLFIGVLNMVPYLQQHDQPTHNIDDFAHRTGDEAPSPGKTLLDNREPLFPTQ